MVRKINSLVRNCLLAAFTVLPLIAFGQVETEPNNSLNAADDLAAASSLLGTVGCSAVDRDDYFTTELPGDGTVRLRVTYTNTSGNAGADAVAYVYDANGSLLASQARNNVAIGATVTDTIYAYSRAKGKMYFRLNSTFCFGYTVSYDLLPPPTDADPEPNDDRSTAAPVAHREVTEGRIGYLSGSGQDREDYYRAILPDDGTVQLTITYDNTSNNPGADASAYIYDGDGTLLTSLATNNVGAGSQQTATLTAYGRGKDTVYFRVYSTFSFGYTLEYELLPPPTAGDPEPNDRRETAAALPLSTLTEGRIGYLYATTQDREDYFKTTLSDDGTVRLIVTYLNTSNNSGADASAYIYAANGTLLRSSATNNVAAGDSRTDTLYAPGRAQDVVYFRIYSTFSFGYRLRVDVLEPETGGDQEPNDDRATAALLPYNQETEGRIGFSSGTGQDREDYFRAVLPDDGTVKLSVTYLNESGNPGADASAYIYDGDGTLLTSVATNNVPASGQESATLYAYGRARDTMYFRIYSTFSFGYRVTYEVLPPPTEPDPEPNNDRFNASPIAHRAATEGRIGYSDATSQDREDFYQAILPDDGSVRLTITYENTSNNPGADASAYIYDGDGTLLTSAASNNVAVDGKATATLIAHCRARDTIYFRVYSTFSFGYTLEYELLPPPTAGNTEPNDTREQAAPIPYNEKIEGRIGYLTATTQDREDYFQAVLPDDGAVRLMVTYHNTSDNGGADASAYIYAKSGTLLTSRANNNQPVTGTRTDTLFAYGRARDTVFFRIYSTFCFGYELKYDLIEPRFGPDPEPNNTRMEGAPVGNSFVGRVGFLGETQDREDYFRLQNADLASFMIHLDYENESNNTGADLFVHLYNGQGRILRTFPLINQPLGPQRTTLEVECLDPDEVYLRISSSFAFSYRVRLEVIAEQPHAEIEYSRFGNRFAFVANSRRAESILWDFDDGSSSTQRYPVREFPIGVYDVTLAATNEACEETVVTTEQIQVTGIESYTPHSASMYVPSGFFAIRVFGAGFGEGTEVSLSRAGATVAADRIGIPSPAELTAIFRFDQAGPGTYDLRIKLGNGETFDFPNGFTIIQDDIDEEVDLDVDISGPANIRTNRWANFSLMVTNNRSRLANGVVACIVTPRNVETDLMDIVKRRSGKLLIKGDMWNRLTIDREDFNEVYFDGEFDPDVDTVEVDYNSVYNHLETYMKVDIDTLYGDPFRGTLHMLYIPLVRGNETRQVTFKMRSPTSQSLTLAGYALPFTIRNNPISGETLDWIHEGGTQAAALAGAAPHPWLKALGKAAGYVDIGSQIVFAEGVDLYYGTNTADAEFYAKQGVSLGAEVFNNHGPQFKKGSTGAQERALDFNKQANHYATNAKVVERQLKIGKFREGMQQELTDKLNRYKNEVARLREAGATEEAIDLATLEFKNWAKGRGIDITSRGIQSLIDFPDDTDDNRPKRINRRRVRSITSRDPNAIYGETGMGDRQYIRGDEVLSYFVAFENVDTAEAPAQIVRVEVALDTTKFDWRTTTLGHVTFGGNTYFLEESRQEYWRDIDLRPAQNLVVRVNAKLDTLTGRLSWQFTSLDPDTGGLPADALAGFLPPNKNSPEGEGGLTFSSRLLPGVTNNDSIGAQALIYFDDNDPIATNVWTNRIDAAGPVSELEPSYVEVNDTTIRIRYAAVDEESGVENYFLRFRREGDAWTEAAIPLEADGETEVFADNNYAYEFYVVAQDSVGNRESKEPRAELSVTLGTVAVAETGLDEIGISVFPNPAAEGHVYLKSEETVRGARIVLLDPVGRMVREYRLDLMAELPQPLRLGRLGRGVYTLWVTTPEGRRWARQVWVQGMP
ncbi:hypothetical protein GGR26_002208 [Lewinella marina]|uniref:DUF7619 domain-containing protein n=1 Tax=Neolewinella marina TaxID=438751 RepID=A0A2G0CGL0_9BACT|nr:PKD domain-containing protein [Neolewinella marina]NJB86440.1 hypothetical protein [Neolewinella marina]PHK99098.1 hypothetical protein CGL56_06455 [Neolewinella marina]